MEAAAPVTELELTWFEFLDAVNVGLYRFARSHLAELNPATTYARDWLERLADEAVGASSERAYHKWRGAYWDGAIDTFHVVPDAPGGVEIRGTTRADGSLIVRDNDPAERFYVLVIAQPPRYRIVGGIRGYDARRPEYERNPHGHRRAWFVPQHRLIPPRTGP